jgi:hypothetical protein
MFRGLLSKNQFYIYLQALNYFVNVRFLPVKVLSLNS